MAHGGFLTFIADTGMGNAAHIAAGNKRCVTINLDIKYISAGKLNEEILGKVKVLKRTKTFLLNEVIQIIKKQENSKYQKILFCLCILLLVAISISSIGPINHPDAADYHVGYPFQYFSRGKFFVDGGLHQGLLGIGDYANLAFIQENTNWFIRFVQIINLPLLFIFLAKKFNNNIYLLSFLSIPIIIKWSNYQQSSVSS